MSHPFKDTTPEREAAPSELEAYDDLQQRVNELDYDGTYKGGDNQRLFFVSFDGTRNNRDNVDADNVYTNPDILERIAYQQTRENPHIASWYNQGVGTEEDLFPGAATYRAATGAGSEEYAIESEKFTRRKTSPVFVDEVANISISPNGACRLHLISWQNDEQNKPVQINSEIIMTIQSLKTLSDALPKAIEAADKAIAGRQNNTAPVIDTSDSAKH